MLTSVVTTSATREECYAGLVAVTAATQGPATAESRALRIWTLSQAWLRPSMRTALGAEQQRLTDSLTDLAREAQEKGWFRADLDPAAVAVFIQAYTLGKAVDDLAPRRVDQRAWETLVNTVVATVFMADPALLVERGERGIPAQPTRTMAPAAPVVMASGQPSARSRFS
jgi:hypothetical protein